MVLGAHKWGSEVLRPNAGGPISDSEKVLGEHGVALDCVHGAVVAREGGPNAVLRVLGFPRGARGVHIARGGTVARGGKCGIWQHVGGKWQVVCWWVPVTVGVRA